MVDLKRLGVFLFLVYLIFIIVLNSIFFVRYRFRFVLYFLVSDGFLVVWNIG